MQFRVPNSGAASHASHRGSPYRRPRGSAVELFVNCSLQLCTFGLPVAMRLLGCALTSLTSTVLCARVLGLLTVASIRSRPST